MPTIPTVARPEQHNLSSTNPLRSLCQPFACGLIPILLFAITAIAPSESIAENNRIVAENQRTGTTDWQLTRVRPNAGRYRTSLVEGYCSEQSLAVGEELKVFISSDPAVPVNLDIYRMGYYGGTGGRLVKTLSNIDTITQPVPDAGKDRVRQCKWEPSVSFTIPEDWVSGVYLGKLTTVPEADQPYWQSYVIFIVKDDRPADFVFQCSDNTWQAYNRWPVNDSLYTHPDGPQKPGVAVSFDRPYGMYCQIFEHPLSLGSGEFLLWEFPLCFWMEQQGYDVTYVSNSDLLNPGEIDRCKTFLSVGHDEYWDTRQYDTVAAAIDRGVNVLWLSANSVYMVSPFSPSESGQPNRIITRTGSFGPLREEETQTYGKIMGPFETHGPDERKIIGARTVVPFNGGGDWVCTQPKHWIYEGTQMRRGDRIEGLIGWEHHGDPDLQRPGLQVVAEGTTWAGGTNPGHWTATIFPGPKGNFVFNAATIYWAQGLATPPGHIIPWSHYSRPHGPDRRVQQITKNLFERSLQKTQD
ncbi:hypothetical protein CA51_37410 [Rosistilla oblonga]|uniref:N,N-dimethylformamidase beta subunit family domain-containing protein n=1 Tax=Rosistilla oblonga TaxID=2527990 RepID=UPI00118C0AF6|nr:N,N-dimethylformamidase beta subunit family domain-containing protein [Rosistilla oblonga]QDV13850.1 hypothetical protein CA51_37410 [Rosistilla oblonga]